MQEQSIRHQPSMADELMQQLAPLLAAEGIDLTAEDADYTLEDINAAMARAVEQHHLTLFTPVGHDRELSLAFFVEFAEAFATGGQIGAQPLLASVQPEETADRPAASFVIGAGLGLIDSWFEGGGEYASLLARITIPKWRGPARKIAIDLRSLGASGRAFESNHSFTVRHGGEMLMHGVAILVGAAIQAVAMHEHVDAAEAFGQLQAGAEGHGSSSGVVPGSGVAGGSGPRPAPEPRATLTPRTGSAFGLGADGQPPASGSAFGSFSRGAGGFYEGFAEWLTEVDEDEEGVISSVMVLQAAESLAKTAGLSVHHEFDYEELVELITQLKDKEQAEVLLEVLSEYVMFRGDIDLSSHGWEDNRFIIENAQMNSNVTFNLLRTTIEESSKLPRAEVKAALLKLRPLTAVRDLHVWLGKSKGITSTGGIKRADIATVAAMIGIRAEGVAKVPPVTSGEDQEIEYAQTMWSVPELAYWWISLQSGRVIELTASRVAPGPGFSLETGEWSEHVALDRLGASLVAQVLEDIPGVDEGWYNEIAFVAAGVSIQRVIETLGADGYRAEHYDPTHPDNRLGRDASRQGEVMRTDTIFQATTARCMDALKLYGFLEEREGALVVPELLGGVVAQGIMQSLSYLDSVEAKFETFEE